MAKFNGRGQAKVLSQAESQSLLGGIVLEKNYRAVFQVCLSTGCRINEAVTLRLSDIKTDSIVFQRENTKGKKRERQIPISLKLRSDLICLPRRSMLWVFSGNQPGQHLTTRACMQALAVATTRLGIEGVSTHSFRRTALTRLYRAGVPLRTIMEISGHSSLASLQRYLEVDPEDVKKALEVLIDE